jgi:hypothetical protein
VLRDEELHLQNQAVSATCGGRKCPAAQPKGEQTKSKEQKWNTNALSVSLKGKGAPHRSLQTRVSPIRYGYTDPGNGQPSEFQTVFFFSFIVKKNKKNGRVSLTLTLSVRAARGPGAARHRAAAEDCAAVRPRKTVRQWRAATARDAVSRGRAAAAVTAVRQSDSQTVSAVRRQTAPRGRPRAQASQGTKGKLNVHQQKLAINDKLSTASQRLRGAI